MLNTQSAKIHWIKIFFFVCQCIYNFYMWVVYSNNKHHKKWEKNAKIHHTFIEYPYINALFVITGQPNMDHHHVFTYTNVHCHCVGHFFFNIYSIWKLIQWMWICVWQKKHTHTCISLYIFFHIIIILLSSSSSYMMIRTIQITKIEKNSWSFFHRFHPYIHSFIHCQLTIHWQ